MADLNYNPWLTLKITPVDADGNPVDTSWTCRKSEYAADNEALLDADPDAYVAALALEPGEAIMQGGGGFGMFRVKCLTHDAPEIAARQRRATANFHHKLAGILEQHGQPQNAQMARAAGEALNND